VWNFAETWRRQRRMDRIQPWPLTCIHPCKICSKIGQPCPWLLFATSKSTPGPFLRRVVQTFIPMERLFLVMIEM
jgi:hypothetical protein